jgi:hypothetical protein
LVQIILWFNWMKVTYRSRQTAYIYITELVWPHTFIVRSWCNRVEWLYGVCLCLLYCTVLYDFVNWLYGVKKISIQWLWPVKVTLKVIQRWLLVFCWSCDEGHLKWDKKIAEPPDCHYGSNEPNLASQFEWSVNTIKVLWVHICRSNGQRSMLYPSTKNLKISNNYLNSNLKIEESGYCYFK